MLSLLIAVPSMQKSMKSSFMGGTCSFISLLFCFDENVGTEFFSVLPELLFLWLLLVIAIDHSKTDFERSARYSEVFDV